MTLTDPITHTTHLTGIRWLSLATAFGSVVTGGTLFGFSAFVLPALRRLPTAEAVAAMQAINVQAPRSVLMLPLVGSALGSVAIVVLAVVRSDTPNRGWLLAGAAAGLLTFVITAVYHVPHNDAFARLDPACAGRRHGLAALHRRLGVVEPRPDGDRADLRCRSRRWGLASLSMKRRALRVSRPRLVTMRSLANA